ncbi:hypothetical protein GTP41_09405 [Pseudoduganella sp. DS3]|uniref:Uncharacterized protein n=1 Tax=Pseudoduganella guangdongensis TaxID=2692179 RepID=A0A6N9HHL7_9BURK|nr:hypothetical protein [Pseudoduganella guangdongensis]MYN02315.1 hypothetical protein [Pseudoduganella guangdongensis]
MDATPPPELANHEERITRLENAMKVARGGGKINARMDAQHHLMVALQVAILLALIALLAQS